MFTGIIETLAKVESIEKEQSNVHFTFSSSITHELKIDQSVAHNGVCLTVVKLHRHSYWRNITKNKFRKFKSWW